MGKSKEILKIDNKGFLIKTFKSTTECSLIEGFSRKKLLSLIKNKESYNGFIYKFSGKFSDEIDKSNFNFKCPFCNECFETYNGLSIHISSGIHGYISKEEILTLVKYNGKRPTCKCGCGEYTKINYQGGAHFLDYISGHHSRIHNNWGHNLKSIQNSSETRKKQYATGERQIWNKGKKWEDTYTKEKIEILLEKIHDRNRCEKISKKLKGKHKTTEHAIKCRENGSSEYTKTRLREELLKRINRQQFSLSSQIERDFIETFIKPLNVEYILQYYIPDIHQYCDVFIPEKNLIIECDGSFWHADPRLFPEGPKYPYQKTRIEKDKIKNNYAKNNNITILRFWEIDIKENKEIIAETIKKHILN